MLLLLALLSSQCFAQDENKESAPLLSEKDFLSLSERANGLENKLDKATIKYLSKLEKIEVKLRCKLAKKDSLKAQALFAGIEEKYASIRNTPKGLSKYANVYSGHLDSLATSLNFLKESGVTSDQLDKSLTQFTVLQAKLNQTETIRKFVQERKQLLRQQFERLGMVKELKTFQKQAYYYSQQLSEIKAMWEDPSKLEKKLLQWAMQSEKFKDFFRQNSQLASIFPLPGSATSTASVGGLQTRTGMQQAIAAQFGTQNIQQVLQQNIQQAQGQINELRNKLLQLRSGSFDNSTGDIDLPDGFKPNSQKTKTFLQRLEYGANIQSQKANNYFPTTSDIGLSVGYKLNDKSSVGIGASYKLGWGRGWNRIRMTSEGVGLRSYLDYQLKGSIYISGGYEQNYRAAFHSIEQLKDFSAWQTSGLLGLSKRYKVSKKLRGDVKLLWDFLSYQQIPRTQSLLFRVSYNLK